MEMKFKALGVVAVTVALLLPVEAGERSYAELAKSVGDYVRSLGETKVFAIVEEKGEARTTITFINGNKREKVDHATPLRVSIRIDRGKDGRSPKYRVKAVEEGIVLRHRDRRAEKQWEEQLRKHLEGGG